MIYFKSEKIKIARHFDENPVIFHIVNEVSGEKKDFELSVSVESTYYELDFSGIELKNGTYRYDFGSECGLLRVGDYVAEQSEYDNKKINVIYER